MLLAVAAVLFAVDKTIAVSLVWGVSACLVPGMCFVWYAFKYRGAQQTAAVVRGFYRGEAIKFLVTGAVFAMAFKRADQIHSGVFFTAFVVAQILSWSLSAITIKQSR